jgi:predicted metal-binding membrane protein
MSAVGTAVGAEISPRMTCRQSSESAFVTVAALAFAASTAQTIAWCMSMSGTGMPMPGGWTMSMAWMRMPGQTWPGAAASFVGMWAVMMVAMMLPSLIPMLRGYRESIRTTGETRLGRLTALIAAGYFLVWASYGMAVYPLGLAVAVIEMRQPAFARAAPLAVGVVILFAGLAQRTPWKLRHLACCRRPPGASRAGCVVASYAAAGGHGLRLGLHCSGGCSPLIAILLVTGVMDLRAMAVVGAAITSERLAPAGDRVARAIGALAICSGLLLIAQAAGLESKPVIHLCCT